MAKFLNIEEGFKINRLTFLEKTNQKSFQGDSIGIWLCECNYFGLFTNSKVLSGHTKSCGCYGKEARQKGCLKHGNSRKSNESLTYTTWQGLKDRCLNLNNNSYKHYGGRGIKVCDRWLEPNGKGFINFLEDMGEKPDRSYSIERIDYNGNYCKENCKWIPRKQQNRNKRNSLFVNLNGEKMCLSEACEKLSLVYKKTVSKYRKYKILPDELTLWSD